MTIDFNGQVAIVTGAGRGMGREMALLLARRGASVLVNDFGGDTDGHPGEAKVAESVAAEIRCAGGNAVANGDAVGTSASAGNIVRAALDAFGRIDILINNAGYNVRGAIPDLDDDVHEAIMRTNYWGAYLLVRRVWPLMQRQNYGRIVNVSSSGSLGIGLHGTYASAKAAMIGLTSDAAIQGKPHDIKVSALFPSGHTRLGAKAQEDARRWMEASFPPSLVAQAVAYFVSRDMVASGETYSVGGGRVSRIASFNNDGFFTRDLTPEDVAAHIDEIRDMSCAVPVTSSMEENMRFTKWLPWTGGRPGTI